MVKTTKTLRPLRTEGQGMPGDTMFAPGTTYGPVAICIPMGIGIKKAFNGNGGIKLEFGFRFTNTDYLDDVSGSYYDWAANGGTQDQITMSGTRTGQEWTYIGYATKLEITPLVRYQDLILEARIHMKYPMYIH